MLIAKIEQGNIVDIADYRAMFPNRSISEAGITDEWLSNNGCMAVSVFKPYDSNQEKLINTEPYIEGDRVFTVTVVPLDQQELYEVMVQKINTFKETVKARAQQRLDDFARTREYDGILSLCTYATDPDPSLAAEGQYGVTVRSATWKKLYQIMEEVLTNQRPMPNSFEDLEPDLPVLEWPT